MYVEVHGSPIRDRNGEIRLVVAHCLDVTEKRRHEAELRRKVREDSLTGLLSRAAFESDLLAMLHGNDRSVCVIYIDVDRFKTVNDSYGHGVGDEVLRTLASRLQDIAPTGSLLARLGGDEFALAVPGTSNEGERVGQAIVASCESPFKVAGGFLQVTVSVGLSMAGSPDQAEQAVISADTAMYAAKQTGRDQLMMFNDQMRLDTGRRVAAELLLREALEGDRSQTMPLWFQPIVALDTRRVVGAEALVRLLTMDGDMVAPSVFVPVAEETGLVVQVGEHVLETALAHLHRWGDRLSYVSVNVSPRQLSEAGFLSMLTRLLEESGVEDRSRLVLEITETSLLNTSVDLTEMLHQIKALGVRLALDDFGTGYSSLTWLKSVPADIVKLDRSFVAGLSRDADKASIISAVLWLASSLGMSVVAEGVEDVEDWIALERARCPAAQGFLFSRPVTPEDLERLMTLTDPSTSRPVVLPRPRADGSTDGAADGSADGPVGAPAILSDPAMVEAIEFDRTHRLAAARAKPGSERGGSSA
jgi:diguanylate cyclase (GGDEF)-like protein